MKTGKRQYDLIALVLAAVLVLVLTGPAGAETRKSSNAPNPRYAAIVIDADSGAVLYERHADKRLHPASLVKMMTLLMAFEALENGTLTLNSRVRISSHANSQPPSRIDVPVGGSISVREAIYALVTKSANNVATALGETIGGSEANFATMMNRRARDLGMTQTVFRNAHGLHHPQQVTSARDMARLSRHLVMNHPKQYKYFSTRNFSYNGASYHNHNRLMETYKGMDGIKTGYIQPSGFNLAASAVRNDRRLIAVVFGGRTTQSRNAHVAELLDQGFAQLGAGKDVRIARSIDGGSKKTVTAQAPVPPRKPAQRDMLQDSGREGRQALAASAPEIMGGELIGEGDFDPAVARRFEAGMVAISALKGQGRNIVLPVASVPVNITEQKQIAATPTEIDAGIRHAALTHADWAVQIGAFTSRVRSDQALNEAVRKLPAGLRDVARPVIVPMQAGDGWVFRARLRGLSRDQAMASCKYFENCMTISPRAF